MSYVVSDSGLWEELETLKEFVDRYEAIKYGKEKFDSDFFYLAEVENPDYIKLFFADEVLDEYEEVFIEYFRDISIDPTEDQKKELERSLNDVLSNWLYSNDLIKYKVVVNEEEILNER